MSAPTGDAATAAGAPAPVDPASSPAARPSPDLGPTPTPTPAGVAPPPVAPAASPPPDRPRHAGMSPLGIVRDNVEAIAFALILALLLRHCVVEVFKIPTGSMEPTLLGDNSATRPGTPGDRILVAKDAYLFRDPQRWDVIVFHYPLHWPRAFIKRLVGLPHDALRIQRGDPWIGDARAEGEPTLHPARKPASVRDELYLPVYPPAGAPAKLRPDAYWRDVPGGPGTLEVPAHGRLVYGGDAPGRADDGRFAVRAYGFPIRDFDSPTSDPNAVSSIANPCPDVRLRLAVTPSAAAEVELVWEPGDGRRHALRIGTPGRVAGQATTSRAARPLGATLVPGRRTTLALESVDGDLRAWVDGDEVAVLADELTLEEAIRYEDLGEGVRQSMTIGVRGGPTTIDDVRLDRDLYYTNYRANGTHWPRSGDVLRLGPEDHFMLGDNTRSSSDSRCWNASGVELRDGRRILWDPQQRVDRRTVGTRVVREVEDVEGVVRTWFEDEEDPNGAGGARLPFVKRDRIIGKAWFALVFWPLEELLPRIRFVH